MHITYFIKEHLWMSTSKNMSLFQSNISEIKQKSVEIYEMH